MAIDDLLSRIKEGISENKYYIIGGALLIGACALDTYLTQTGLANGTHIEGNPIMKYFIDNYGFSGFYAAKFIPPAAAPFIAKKLDDKVESGFLGKKTGAKTLYGLAAIVGTIPFTVGYLLPKLSGLPVKFF